MQTINGFPIVASINTPAESGTRPGAYIVFARETDFGTAWHAEGEDSWSCGHYGMAFREAIDDMLTRAARQIAHVDTLRKGTLSWTAEALAASLTKDENTMQQLLKERDSQRRRTAAPATREPATMREARALLKGLTEDTDVSTPGLPHPGMPVWKAKL